MFFDEGNTLIIDWFLKNLLKCLVGFPKTDMKYYVIIVAGGSAKEWVQIFRSCYWSLKICSYN